MKKLTLFAALLMLTQLAFAGGLLTNTNQSAQFIRMLSRNASTDIDAVYFNPAGLIKLQDGWHFAFYSQTIFQDKTVDSNFPLLNDGYYVGEVQVPVFPTAFAVYKKENWSFSLGFGPNAGGGSADFDRGLPSFEIPITKIVPGLAGLKQIDPSLNVTGYNADINFSGSSVFWGIQLGATYKINDVLSVYGGVRYLPSKNTYEGSIQNIQLKVGSQYVGAAAWLTGTSGTLGELATMASAAATQLSGTASNLQPLIDGGAGTYTLAQLEGANYIDATTRGQIEGGLLSLGVTQQQIDQMPLSSVQGTYSTAAATYSGQATILTTTAGKLAGTADQLGDKNVNTKQTGAGITPIFGVNISPSEDWNIGLKYEPKTKLTLKNEPQAGDNYSTEIFDNNINSDIPGILGVGIEFKGLEGLEAQLSYTEYFNKGVNWGSNLRYSVVGQEVKRESNNGYELGLGLQFNLSDKFAVSFGSLYGDMGVADSYQSDFSYSNPSLTYGGGIKWKINDKLVLDAGISDTDYSARVVSYTDPDVGNYTEKFDKTTITFAAGLSYSIF